MRKLLFYMMTIILVVIPPVQSLRAEALMRSMTPVKLYEACKKPSPEHECAAFMYGYIGGFTMSRLMMDPGPDFNESQRFKLIQNTWKNDGIKLPPEVDYAEISNNYVSWFESNRHQGKDDLYVVFLRFLKDSYPNH